jgi:NitT/TauT family transport system ATP-binding protein
MESKALLTISGLTFAYDELTLQKERPSWTISDLSLNVYEAEILCILGASGCGKSTLLNLIAGLIKPSKGAVEFPQRAGKDRRIGYIFQQDALLPWRTVEANLMLASELTTGRDKQTMRSRIEQYLSIFHLKTDILPKYPNQLSGGMRQRVSIMQSLMFDPQLFLLDEPFSALDFYTKLSLENEFYQLVKEQKKGAILVTHDIEEAVAMADRVIVMSKEGLFTREYKIEYDALDRTPENARGTAQFAELYRTIWSELKAVIEE